MQANVDAGCCVSNSVFHRKCMCDGFLSPVQCQSLCSNDPGCKGYVMLKRKLTLGDPCHLATTSCCPVSCRAPESVANIGPIDPNSTCGNGNRWNGGCLIKRGILLHYRLIITFEVRLMVSIDVRNVKLRYFICHF